MRYRLLLALLVLAGICTTIWVALIQSDRPALSWATGSVRANFVLRGSSDVPLWTRLSAQPPAHITLPETARDLEDVTTFQHIPVGRYLLEVGVLGDSAPIASTSIRVKAEEQTDVEVHVSVPPTSMARYSGTIRVPNEWEDVMVSTLGGYASIGLRILGGGSTRYVITDLAPKRNDGDFVLIFSTPPLPGGTYRLELEHPNHVWGLRLESQTRLQLSVPRPASVSLELRVLNNPKLSSDEVVPRWWFRDGSGIVHKVEPLEGAYRFLASPGDIVLSIQGERTNATIREGENILRID